MFRFVLALCLAVPAIATPSHVWPYPASTERNGDVYQLKDGFYDFTFAPNASRCPAILEAINRTKLAISKIYRPKAEGPVAQDMPTETVMLSKIILHFSGDCEEFPYLHMNENYSISPGELPDFDVIVSVKSDAIWGTLHALESFSQLVYYDESSLSLVFPAVTINDSPRFAHRGFMIDTARHFVNTDTIRTMLELLHMNKFNALHWHIVDDQSFPYESAQFPDMSKNGAWAPYLTYSKSDIKDVVSYAAKLGIRVVPEFDTPGHTQSWGKGVPGLLTQCYSSEGKPTGFGPVDPTNEDNYEFLATLFTEIGTDFPDQYFHLGGDEVSFNCWKSNPNISAFMKEHNFTDYAKLEEFYMDKLLPIVHAVPKSYAVWEEVFNNGVDIDKSTVVELWLHGDKAGRQKDLKRVTSAGYKTILSACFYLNYISYGQDWHKYYECDPRDFDGTDEEKALVVGGEACMWGEYVDQTNIVARSFPRASAVAEQLWSPESVTKNGGAAAANRLQEHRCRMYERGYNVEPLSPHFCPADAALNDAS